MYADEDSNCGPELEAFVVKLKRETSENVGYVLQDISGLPICCLSTGYPHPFLDVLGGIFSPLLQHRGYHSVFRAANPSQAMSEDSKSNFECSLWILTAKCIAHCFSQYHNFQNQKITMLENMGYITELTAWHFY